MPVVNFQQWTGWWRPTTKGKWLPMVNGATMDGTWRALLDAAHRAGLNGGLAVLPAGERPDTGQIA